MKEKIRLSLLLYNLFLILFKTGIRIAALWKPKASQWIKGRKNFPHIPFAENLIWMHCASLGEFEQGRPVLEALKNKYPAYKIALSFFSPSGYEVRKNYMPADWVIYLPADNALNAKKLVAALNPSLVIWIKYEFWYYYLSELKRRNIPVLLVSAIFRDSQPFFKWYGHIWKKMLGRFTHLFVQNEMSERLLAEIAVQNVSVSGDTRFDRVVAVADEKKTVHFIEEFIDNKQVVVAGSTWEDDEIELIHYVRSHPEKRFIIAPHEVDKATLEDVKKEFKNAVFYSELTAGQKNPEGNNVLIIDNVGMLSSLYRYADITYVGGGFRKDGIHNILEAAVYGKPVVFGPVYEKFAEAKDLIIAGGAFSIGSALELESLLDRLLKQTSLLEESGRIAGNYVLSKTGATEKILNYVTENRLLIN